MMHQVSQPVESLKRKFNLNKQHKFKIHMMSSLKSNFSIKSNVFT